MSLELRNLLGGRDAPRIPAPREPDLGRAYVLMSVTALRRHDARIAAAVWREALPLLLGAAAIGGLVVLVLRFVFRGGL